MSKWIGLLPAAIVLLIVGVFVAWYSHGWYTLPCDELKNDWRYSRSYAPARCL